MKYVVHRDGSVYSHRFSNKRIAYRRPMKPTIDKDGYLRIIISTGLKEYSFAIHRLVCKGYVENPLGKPSVNHLNGIKNDNRFNNLEWVTSRENKAHALKTGLIKRTGCVSFYNKQQGWRGEIVWGGRKFKSRISKEKSFCEDWLKEKISSLKNEGPV